MASLAELKEQNLADETESEVMPEIAEIEGEEATDDLNENSGEIEGEAGDGETEGEDTEAWLTDPNEEGDEQGEPEGEKLFTGSDIAAAKRKLKTKVGEQASELDELREKISTLESRGGVQTPTGKPKRNDFLNAEDPDEAYLDAYHDWKSNTSRTATDQRDTQVEAKRIVDEKVDRHYEDASKLIKDHGINEDVYRSADLAFRHAVESAMPKLGDIVTDSLIAKLGEGSAKTILFVGRNKAKLAEFQSILQNDKSGLAAAMYISEQKMLATMPKKSIRKAPPPATELNGDATTTTVSADARKYEKQYNAAHSKKNGQEAYNVRKAAKLAGVDVSNW